MYITLFVTVWTAPLYDNYFLIQFITIENGDILYPPQYYSDVAPTAWPPFDEPYAKQLTNSWYHTADIYQPQGWNNVSGRSTLDRTMTVRRSSTVVREKFLLLFIS